MKYYSIGEAAKINNVSTSMLRYYDEINILKPKKIEDNKYRYYTSEQFEILDFIKRMKRRGVSLQIIKALLPTPHADKISEQLSNEIARIDVYVSYAKVAIENDLVCPSFNTNGIYIKDGFHPSLFKIQNSVVKNDTQMNNGDTFIITGANMSGKSTYLKHNAIIVLLSQIGAYVPAKEANISIVDRIFFRQSSTDDIVNSNSSFMIEMNDLKFILENVTDYSFVLLDEPAKSTNAKEGGAISRAVCEYLIQKTSAKIMVATHNLELTKIEKLFPQRVYNYVIGNNNVSETIIYDRKIRRGIVDSSFAINTAILAKLPEEVISLAKKYSLN